MSYIENYEMNLGGNKTNVTSAVVDIMFIPEQDIFLSPIYFWNELKERVRMEI